MAPQTPDNEWIRQKLDTLTDYADKLYNIHPGATNEIGPWAALKLFHLIVTVDLYTRIIHKTNGIDRKLYFDVLAGSGIVELEDLEVNIYGSPIIAAVFPEYPFDELHFFEGKEERATALSQRLDYIADETPLDIDRDACFVHQGDANQTVPETVEDIIQESGYSGTNQLTFADNERMEISWETMIALSRIWGDYLINFQHKGISRELGYLESGDASEQRIETAHRKLHRFVGGQQYRDCSSVDELRDLYKQQLATIGEEYDKPNNNRPINKQIRVTGAGDRYSYDLIYATRETDSGSPYIQFMDNMRDRIERMSGDNVSDVIDIMQGNATGLDEFIPDASEVKRDEDQSSLGDF
ncbi:hypothetical protein NDI85_21425 [Halomicroarcula sp. S1AR25-4]|uniref:hypothetical protein n=1 Tax=Haloarcula sp. S1AR25-4 TaxID=2950538 RepID=UPI00287720C2|nr:hypothetical protein [Halomicroarcula sp. S1AR25-4]MDS0280350.1 hypothetical protein [Halomicroarcula sp. S1AR25-4]